VKRLLTIIAFGAVLVVASPASASDLPLSSWTQFAVNDAGAFWVKTNPKGCTNCDQLWKMDLRDGSTHPVVPAFPGTITDLTAAGDFVAFTQTVKSKKSYATAVWLSKDQQVVSTVARGQYNRGRKRNCGTLVGAGALSPEGELAWQRIDVPRAEGICEWLASRVQWSAFATRLHGADRVLIQPRKSESELLSYDEGLETVRPIRGFNGTQLLTAPDGRPLVLNDLSTGAVTNYLPPGFEDYGGTGELSPRGEVMTTFTTSGSKGWTTALFANPSDGKTYTDLSVVGQAGGDAKFCGGKLFQLVQYSRSISVLERDGAGNITSSKTFQIGKKLSTAQLQCNSKMGLVTLEKLGRNGHILAERTFSFDL
jgi:hypothetical protein